ncbi:hypothetical protein HMPREF0201_02874 [Cedecea davisae DSM 4568]|uniref:Uncharacterized protein n=1 Tax=Cedecea davisae DSM 4568 TaxID=566551 RepID=S3IU40_9ENTR|nr:hypothetical protein HMPREF0201_02874 [Cedecea davisae DSM 4568]
MRSPLRETRAGFLLLKNSFTCRVISFYSPDINQLINIKNCHQNRLLDPRSIQYVKSLNQMDRENTDGSSFDK